MSGAGAQSVAAGGGSGAALAAHDLRPMIGMPRSSGAGPRSGAVLGDDGLAVEQTYRAIVGDEGEGLLDDVRRHRVEVGVEAGEGGLVESHGHDNVGRRQGIGQRGAERLFSSARQSAIVALPEVGMALLVRDVVEEGRELAVAVLDVVDVAASEEALAKEADLSLHASLLVAPVRGAEPQLDVHGAAEVEQQGMEAGRVAVAFEHDDLRIVEEPLPRVEPPK